MNHAANNSHMCVEDPVRVGGKEKRKLQACLSTCSSRVLRYNDGVSAVDLLCELPVVGSAVSG